jgi:hypothetical protein
MIKDFFKIADFLDKSGRTKDSNTIDYIAMKYAGGDLKDFFKRGMHKDYLDTEFGKKVARKKYGVVEREHSLEEDETEELLKSLSARLAEE